MVLEVIDTASIRIVIEPPYVLRLTDKATGRVAVLDTEFTMEKALLTNMSVGRILDNAELGAADDFDAAKLALEAAIDGLIDKHVTSVGDHETRGMIRSATPCFRIEVTRKDSGEVEQQHSPQLAPLPRSESDQPPQASSAPRLQLPTDPGELEPGAGKRRAPTRHIYVVEFPGLALGGVLVARAPSEERAIALAELAMETKLDRSDVTVKRVSRTASILYFWNGDY